MPTDSGDSSEYMTFEQASAYLNTTRSTLYRWLREQKVPAHKLGRQWRFLRHELDTFLRGDVTSTVSSAPPSPRQLRALLSQRLADRLASHPLSHKESIMQAHIEEADAMPLTQRLVWDACDAGASVIHISPTANKMWRVQYRTHQALDTIETIDTEQFDMFVKALVLDHASSPRDELLHPFLFTRHERQSPLPGKPDELQVNARLLHTVEGPRLTMRLSEPVRSNFSALMVDPESREVLETWCAASHGLVLVTGVPGSGKTSTVRACLHHIATHTEGRVVFELTEHEGASPSPHVNQIVASFDDRQAYRHAYQAVMDSDPDVLSIGAMGHGSSQNAHVWESALSAAQEGHLVFLQLEADGPEQAIERMERALDRSINEDLLGVCWQQLQRDAQGRVSGAEYMLLGGLLA